MKRKEDGKPDDEQPPSKIAKQDISPFSKTWQNSDAVLIVEERELHVHSMILSLSSQYFDKMFNGNFVEATTKRVTLPVKSYELIELMLRCIYPNVNYHLGIGFTLLCSIIVNFDYCLV